ncbi:MAG: glutamine-hydrolyzing GMP synthase [Spirochaeta sp.]|jgi:GMP synthase (glutamine-hydrolysing)|nr:glutamine-hydrolyzing GMP synthase [Spirochaeta sp.]
MTPYEPEQIDRIVVLDFGSQTCHLIGRRIRERGVYVEIVPGETDPAEWFSETVKGIILSGSPASVHDADAPYPSNAIYSLGVPILGICYGLQFTTHTHGGVVAQSSSREYGPAPVSIHDRHPVLEGIGSRFLSWMSHGDAIRQLPAGGSEIASTVHGVPAVISIPSLAFVGLQFHPEVTHTQNGALILDNFATRVCGARRQWSVQDYRKQLESEVRERVGDDNVLLLISGGVDSSVVAALLLNALPAEQIHLMYIDTGLMRKGESAEIGTALKALGAQNLYLIDAADDFLTDLAGVADPEEKRRIIGDMFVSVQDREVKKRFPGRYLLAQGTLYTDLVESGHGVGRHGARIKGHHNVASPLVQAKREAGLVLEPLAALYKDEVRQLGSALGLPVTVVGRHPFPGPGLAVRILGAVTRERCDILREADAIYIQALRDAGLYDEIWQAFAVLLPIQSVGVAGDSRAYGDVIALRAVVSRDGMTADVYDFKPDVLRGIAAAITNRIPEVGRVVYDVSGKPPATIEWE